MKNIISPFLILLLVFTSISSRADILFLNLNASPSEHRAVQAAAHVMQETLIEFPNLNHGSTLDRATALERLSLEKVKLSKKRGGLSNKLDGYKGLSKLFSAKYRQLIKESDAISAQMDRIDLKLKSLEIKKFELIDLQTALLELEHSGRTLSTLVVSGHSLGGDFWGSGGSNVPREFFTTALEKFPKTFSTLDSIILLACHNGETDKLLFFKESLFSQNKNNLILGFEGSAPGRLLDVSANITYSAMISKNRLFNSPNPDSASTWIKALDREALETTLTLLINDRIGGVKSGLKFQAANELTEDCRVGEGALRSGFNSYEKYMNASQIGFESPPVDSPRTALRHFYRALQKYPIVCKVTFKKRNVFQNNEESDPLPSVEEVIALIHFSNLQLAISHFESTAIASFNAKLQKLSFSSRFQIPEQWKLGTQTRKEVLAYLTSLESSMHQKGVAIKKSGNKANAAAFRSVENFYKKLNRQLRELKDIPREWITYE